MNRQIRILSGLHAGAQTPCDETGRYLIGSDATCSIVLCDEGVAARHCLITIDEFGMTCRALDAAITVEGREVRAGETVSIEDLQVIQCATVLLGVGPLLADWSRPGRALRKSRASLLDPVRSLKRLNPYALFAGVLLGMSGVLGLAYGALSESKVEVTPMRLEAARAWLQKVAPPASELQIDVDGPERRHFLLSGYVTLNQQLAALTAASRASGLRPRVEVYAADDMVSSVARLAQLANIACAPRYRGAGQVECMQPVTSSAVATRLQTITRDIPGLRNLNVQVAPPPMASAPATPPVAPADTPAAPARITQKFAVLMSERGRYLVGRYGEKYTEGQEFDGFRIRRIGLDQVIFERGGRQYEFHVAALGAPDAGPR